MKHPKDLLKAIEELSADANIAGKPAAASILFALAIAIESEQEIQLAEVVQDFDRKILRGQRIALQKANEILTTERNNWRTPP